MWLNALFLFQKFYFSGVIAMSVEKIKILHYFMIAHGKFSVFEGNSYVFGKNEDNRPFYDCAW